MCWQTMDDQEEVRFKEALLITLGRKDEGLPYQVAAEMEMQRWMQEMLRG